MANFNVDFKYGDPIFGIMSFPVGSSDTIEVGDFVMYDGTDLAALTAEDDDDTFIGVANGKSIAGETLDLMVYIQCVAEATVTSGTYTFGLGLKCNYAGAYLESHGTAGSNAEYTLAHVFDYCSSVLPHLVM